MISARIIGAIEGDWCKATVTQIIFYSRSQCNFQNLPVEKLPEYSEFAILSESSCTASARHATLRNLMSDSNAILS